MSITIYHNQRCTKSRAAMALLEEKNISADVIYYLENPPTQKALKELLGRLGIPAKDLIRFGESLAKELGISKKDERSEAEWVKILANNPKLIERPIVDNGKKAVIGRPTEKILDVLP